MCIAPSPQFTDYCRMSSELSLILESLIFTSDQPVSTDFLLTVLNAEAENNMVHEASESGEKHPPRYQLSELAPILEGLLSKYTGDAYPFEIRAVAEGYQFFTKRVYYPYVKQAHLTQQNKRLSRTAMETLAIIAYRQPITKAEMEFIRGVSCDYAVQKLLDKQLVSIVGRSDAPGRPLLYSTSPFFMEYFGIRDMSEMPKLKEFEALAENHMEMFKQSQEPSVSTTEEADAPQVPETDEQRATEQQ